MNKLFIARIIILIFMLIICFSTYLLLKKEYFNSSQPKIYIGRNQWYRNFAKKIFHDFQLLETNQFNAGRKDISIYSSISYNPSIFAMKNILIDGEPFSIKNTKADVIITTKKDKNLLPTKNAKIIYIPHYSMSFAECNMSPYLLLKKHIPKKTKFCAYAASNCNKNMEGVQMREDFFDIFNAYNKVDVLGKCHGRTQINKINLIVKNKKISTEPNWINNIKLFEPYKFVISFENSFIDGYITEKIIIPMLAGAIPIYMGSKDIGEHFNEKSFIHARNFNSLDLLAKEVIRINNDDDLYNKILNEPWLFKLGKHFEWYTNDKFY